MKYSSSNNTGEEKSAGPETMPGINFPVTGIFSNDVKILDMKTIYPKIKEYIFMVLVFCSFCMFISCERVEQKSYPSVTTEGMFVKNEYNLDMQNFSLAVASAIREDDNFRNMLREEALKMFDGDYDVLMSDFTKMKISSQRPLSKSGSFTVGDLLQEHMNGVAVSNGSKGTVAVIDELIEEYPYLQITVPVNAEEWDSEDYVPMVTFIPGEYDETTTEKVIAYTVDGDTVALDAIEPPEEPVIVISMNERIDEIDEPKAGGIPPKPTNLTGTLTESGIRLTWVMPDTTTEANTNGYKIYRKGSADINFVNVSTIADPYFRSYQDNNVEAIAVYTYYVIAFYQTVISAPSNYLTITAPQFPKPVLSFEACQHSKNEIELRWQNDYSQYISETRVYKHIVDQTQGYSLLRAFTANESDYFDIDVEQNKTIIYKASHVTPTGESNPKYDFVKTSFRDISKPSPVYIKQIKFTDWDIEGWLAGRPEFYIKVSNVDANKTKAYEVQDEINCEFNRRSKVSQEFTGCLVLNWKPGFWYDMLTFTAIEYDRPSGDFKFEIGVKYNIKDSISIGTLDGSPGVNFSITFQNKGEKCGNSYLDYFDNPETWIMFPNYGTQILVSESDN